MMWSLVFLSCLCYSMAEEIGVCGFEEEALPQFTQQRPLEPLSSSVRRKPIRIRLFEAKSVAKLQSDDKQKFLSTINKTVDFYQQLLQVVPVPEALRLNFGHGIICYYGEHAKSLTYSDLTKEAQDQHQPIGKNEYKIQNTDLALYLTYEFSNNCGSTLAYATACGYDDAHRPISGQVNLCSNGLKSDLVRVLQHEVMHVLAVNSQFIGKDLKSKAGRIVKHVPWRVNYKIEPRMKETTFVATKYPKTLEAVRLHLGCASVPGIEVENGGTLKSKGKHWEKAVFGNELMTATIEKDSMFSNITATFLSELHGTKSEPFYVVNWSVIQSEIDRYWYGRRLGCTFATNSCREYIDETANNKKNLTPALPLCTVRNVVKQYRNINVCCGERKISTRCQVEKNKQSDFKDINFEYIGKQKWKNLYGYFDDTLAHDFCGTNRFKEFCPMIDTQSFVPPPEGCEGGVRSAPLCPHVSCTGSNKPVQDLAQSVIFSKMSLLLLVLVAIF